MDAEQAIRHHRAWKDRLFAKIATRETISEEETSSHDCEFGKWLFGFAQGRYGHIPSVLDCMNKHSAFHEEAGKVARLINEGETYKASQQLTGSKTQYHAASSALAQSIIVMFGELEKANLPLE